MLFLYPLVVLGWCLWKFLSLYLRLACWAKGKEQLAARLHALSYHPKFMDFVVSIGQVSQIEAIRNMLAVMMAGAPPTIPQPTVLNEAEQYEMAFITGFWTSALLEFFDEHEYESGFLAGNEFAVWTVDGFPREFKALQQTGPDRLIEFYQKAPFYQERIAPRFGEFHKFIHDFCSYQDDVPLRCDHA